MTAWVQMSAMLHERTHRAFAESVAVADADLTAVVHYDAEVMIGEVYDRRTMVEFLKVDLAAADITLTKGTAVTIAGKEFRLDQRLPASSQAIGNSAGATNFTELWMLR